MAIIKAAKYNKLLSSIGKSIELARATALRVVNVELVKANWEIGRHLVEFEQQGEERAEYGIELLARISRDLSLKYGKGFGRRNMWCNLQCYRPHPARVKRD